MTGLHLRARRHLPAVALFALLSVSLSFPLVLHLGTHVPGIRGGVGDNLSFVWNLWWMRTALHAHLNPFHTSYLFHPVGVDLTQHTHTALNAAIGATLLAPLSPVAAQNVLLVASLFLNGLTAYLLAYRLTRNRFAALAGGIAYAGAAPVLVRLLGHFNLVAAWVIPLAVLAWLRAFDRRSVGAGLAAGAALAAAAYSDYYYLVYTVVLLAACVGDRWLDVQVRFPRRRANVLSKLVLAAIVLDVLLLVAIAVSPGFSARVGGVLVSAHTTYNERVAFWLLLGAWALTRRRVPVTVRVRDETSIAADARTLGLAAVTFVCLALPLVAGAARLILAGDYTPPQYGWRSAPAGVDGAAFLVGSPFHPIYGVLTRHAYEGLHLNAMEGVAWLGIVAPAILLIEWRRLPALRFTRFWRLVAALFGIWALGSHLDVFGVDTGVTLPGAFLRFVPVVSNVRIPGRAMVVVSLAVAMLLAGALVRVGVNWSARRRALVIVLLLLDVATSPLSLYPLEASRVYSLLQQQPGPGAVLELPFGLRDGFSETGRFDERTLYFQTISGRPMLGGFVARLPENVKAWYRSAPVVSTLLRLSDPACPADWTPPAVSPQEAHDALARASVRYVVVDRTAASARLLQYVARLPLRSLARDGARELYELREPQKKGGEH